MIRPHRVLGEQDEKMNAKHFGLVTSLAKHSINGNYYYHYYSAEMLTIYYTWK